MEGLKEHRQEQDRDAAPLDTGTAPPTARHRRWWRGLGISTIFWAVAFLTWLIRNSTLMQYLHEIQQTRPGMWMRCMLQTAPLLWMPFVLGVEMLSLLRTYCFARAETTERIKLFDYLRTEPVRLRMAKYIYYDVWVLAALFLLLGLYYLLSPLF